MNHSWIYKNHYNLVAMETPLFSKQLFFGSNAFFRIGAKNNFALSKRISFIKNKSFRWIIHDITKLAIFVLGCHGNAKKGKTFSCSSSNICRIGAKNNFASSKHISFIQKQVLIRFRRIIHEFTKITVFVLGCHGNGQKR